MSVMDSMVVQLRNYVNGTTEKVDESDVFYIYKKAGLDYEAPFAYANATECPGTAEAISGETPIDYYIIAIPEVGTMESEYAKDRLQFLTHDFAKYEMKGAILADGILTKIQQVRKYTYVKKMC